MYSTVKLIMRSIHVLYTNQCVPSDQVIIFNIHPCMVSWKLENNKTEYKKCCAAWNKLPLLTDVPYIWDVW